MKLKEVLKDIYFRSSVTIKRATKDEEVRFGIAEYAANDPIYGLGECLNREVYYIDAIGKHDLLIVVQ